ncbi:trigger factor [Thalassoroseus pseudoceratinae]|uniref:trigger factor n=1 Tax=Thalassoroseus pseudoceratinae TaxID=2713176 RepID=UPI001422EA8F|nr:trigger factor [Thalassoroseus pseudoceratinae]
MSDSDTPTTDQPDVTETTVIDTTANPDRLSLEVDIADAGPCRKHVSVTVPREDIDKFFEAATGELLKTASVPGFRPGYAPRKLIERRFRKELVDEVKRNVLLQSLEQLEEEDQLDPINQPDIDIESLDLPEEGAFTYDFEVEVRPSFDLPDYSGFVIERPSDDVSDEDVENYLQQFLEQFAKFEESDAAAEPGDSVRADIAFEHDGRPLRKSPDQRIRLLPTLRFHDAEVAAFDELMKGAKVGDVRETETTVSEEASSLEMRGETVAVKFTVRKVERMVQPELNSAFFEEVGVESLEKLKELIRGTLERQVTYQQRQRVREQVLEKITESADWSLPEDLVRKQVENAMRREILEMQQAGFTRTQIQSRENELRQNAVSTTRQALKEHFVLDKIAETEGIEVAQSEIDWEIQMMAMQQGENVRRLRTRMIRSGMMDNLEAQIRERKAVDVVLEKAQFKDVDSEPVAEPSTVEAIPVAVCGQFNVPTEGGIPQAVDPESAFPGSA